MWRVLAVAWVLAACSPAPEQKTDAAPAEATAPIVANDTVLSPASHWTCADGQRLEVTFYGAPDRAEVAPAGEGKLNLYGSAAASGTLYEDTSHSFHAKGDSALFTSGDNTITCRKEASH